MIKSKSKFPITSFKNYNDKKYYILSTVALKPEEIESDSKNQGKVDWKPTGLWFGKGNEWVWFLTEIYSDYAMKNAVAFLKSYHKIYEIELKPQANMLKIKTKKSAIEFTKEYGIPIKSRYSFYKWSYLIDWQKVARKYDGIENRDLMWAFDFMWLRGWDVSGGCLFNNKPVQSLKLVFEV